MEETQTFNRALRAKRASNHGAKRLVVVGKEESGSDSPEAEQEEALKVVATLDAAEPPARRTAGKGVTPLLE